MTTNFSVMICKQTIWDVTEQEVYMLRNSIPKLRFHINKGIQMRQF